MESQPEFAARSRLEAMDWSLVLISQGIESVVDRCQQSSGWVIRVSPNDYARALQAIELYRAENRRSRLRRELFQPGLLFDWISLAWVGLICAFHWINATRMDLHGAGVANTVAVAQGQWWRLFTAMWLHAEVAHLASNAVFGVVLLGLTMGRYGTGPGILAAYLAGAGGNLLSWAVATQPHSSLGASGMVMGCLGLLAVQTVPMWRKPIAPRRDMVVGLLGGVMLFVLVGLSPGTDVVAHFGGFASGIFLGALLVPWVRALQKPVITVLSVSVFVVLTLWPWWLALHHAGSSQL